MTACPVRLRPQPGQVWPLLRGVLLACVVLGFCCCIFHLPSKQECLQAARPWNMRVAALFPRAALSEQALDARCEWLSD